MLAGGTCTIQSLKLNTEEKDEQRGPVPPCGSRRQGWIKLHLRAVVTRGEESRNLGVPPSLAYSSLLFPASQGCFCFVSRVLSKPMSALLRFLEQHHFLISLQKATGSLGGQRPLLGHVAAECSSADAVTWFHLCLCVHHQPGRYLREGSCPFHC